MDDAESGVRGLTLDDAVLDSGVRGLRRLSAEGCRAAFNVEDSESAASSEVTVKPGAVKTTGGKEGEAIEGT